MSCGYSLAGLKSERCPECGTINSTRRRKAMADERAVKDTVRQAYLRPVIMFGGGLTVSVVVAMIGAGSFEGGLLSWLFHDPPP